MVRWLGMAFTTELWALVLLQALHAGTFAACHLGAMAFLQRALPASGIALGQSVYYAIGTGVAQAVIFQIAGVLYGAYGQKAFLGMFVGSAVGMVAIVALARRWKRRAARGHCDRWCVHCRQRCSGGFGVSECFRERKALVALRDRTPVGWGLFWWAVLLRYRNRRASERPNAEPGPSMASARTGRARRAAANWSRINDA